SHSNNKRVSLVYTCHRDGSQLLDKIGYNLLNLLHNQAN
ncbi:hypothetical protein L195_g049305, partial [Trifolium pratense]